MPLNRPGIVGLASILAAAFVAIGCGPNTSSRPGDGDGGGGDVFIPPTTDTDNDTISDYHEGADLIDTDGDGTPDYLDDDSDNDGILDALEAGDADVTTPPVDTDLDGIPDFRDNDSDNDGIPDGEEDTNHNGILDPGETDPRNPDTDGDGVSDLIEQVAGTDPNDPADNPQAHGNFVFLVPYQQPPQPPEDTLRFKTNIQKVDLYFLEDISVSMQAELQSIHDNMVTVIDELTCDVGEDNSSCPTDCVSTCGDSSCDPGETALNCPYDCFGTCGDLACVASETNATCPQDCPASCGDRVCGGTEDPANCPTDCAGTCGDLICHAGEQPAITGCIPDLWSGAGAFGTAGPNVTCDGGSGCNNSISGRFVYQNLLDLQSDPQATMNAVPSQCWGAPCWEPGLAATFYTVTGYGYQSATAAGYTMPVTIPQMEVPDPPPCPTGYRGYPCFRPDSLPIILLIGDERFCECYLPDGATYGDCTTAKHCPTITDLSTFPIVSAAVNAIGGKVVGIQGTTGTGSAQLTTDFETLATETGTVDPNGQPYVFQGADANAAQAIADGIRELTSTLPLDMSAVMVDDDTDGVDTVTAFLDYLEAHHPGTTECVDWPDLEDSNGDGHMDKYLGVPAGTPVCWKIHIKENQTVQPTQDIQIFKAYVELWGDGVTLLDTRTVYFVVPPELSGPVID